MASQARSLSKDTLARTQSAPAIRHPPLRNPSFDLVKKKNPRAVFGSSSRFDGGPSSALQVPSPQKYEPMHKGKWGVKIGKDSRFKSDTRLITPAPKYDISTKVIGDGRLHRNNSSIFGKSSRFYAPGHHRFTPGPGQHDAEVYDSISKGAPSSKIGKQLRFERVNYRVRPVTEYKYNPSPLHGYNNGVMEVNRSHKFDRANRFSMYGTTPGKLPFDGVPGPAYDPNFNTELKRAPTYKFSNEKRWDGPVKASDRPGPKDIKPLYSSDHPGNRAATAPSGQ